MHMCMQSCTSRMCQYVSVQRCFYVCIHLPRLTLRTQLTASSSVQTSALTPPLRRRALTTGLGGGGETSSSCESDWLLDFCRAMICLHSSCKNKSTDEDVIEDCQRDKHKESDSEREEKNGFHWIKFFFFFKQCPC